MLNHTTKDQGIACGASALLKRIWELLRITKMSCCYECGIWVFNINGNDICSISNYSDLLYTARVLNWKIWGSFGLYTSREIGIVDRISTSKIQGIQNIVWVFWWYIAFPVGIADMCYVREKVYMICWALRFRSLWSCIKCTLCVFNHSLHISIIYICFFFFPGISYKTFAFRNILTTLILKLHYQVYEYVFQISEWTCSSITQPFQFWDAAEIPT